MHVMDILGPVIVAVAYISLCSLFKEPNRRSFNAIFIAGAGAAYLNGGFGVWEFAFLAVVTYCAYKGLQSYNFIGIGWLLHTGWDVLHHLYGNPIVPFVPDSSFGCAICDPVIALWCFAGAPSVTTCFAERQNVQHDRVTSLAEGGREAVSTRAVAAAAGVQAPTIYRQFGDMRGLLDAVASHGFSEYLRDKTSREHDEDPVEDLRRGWDLHVEFGLANPALYRLMYGDPRLGAEMTAALEASEILHGLVQRVAEAGRLRVGVEQAARMIYATGIGVTLTLLGTDPEIRGPALSDATREAILAAVTTDAPIGPAVECAGIDRVANRAIALKAVLPEAGVELTTGERAVLSEWLDRLSQSAV